MKIDWSFDSRGISATKSRKSINLSQNKATAFPRLRNSPSLHSAHQRRLSHRLIHSSNVTQSVGHCEAREEMPGGEEVCVRTSELSCFSFLYISDEMYICELS